jgi:polysaccharide export outer membrane protein
MSLRPPVWFLCLAALVFSLAAGCGTDAVSPSVASPMPGDVGAAHLRRGDSLTIALQGVPDPSTNAVTIDDNGLITLPFIGSVEAAGLSTAELSQAIRQTYIARKIYTTLDVSVNVTERYVYVDGEVQRPGRIVWTPDLTAAKAVQAAGGFTLYAKENAVTLSRGSQAYVIDVKAAQRSPGQDAKLIPGDSLHVGRSPF